MKIVLSVFFSVMAAVLPLLEEGQDTIQRAGVLTHQLGHLSQEQAVTSYQVFPLQPLIDDTLALCRKTFDKAYTLEAHPLEPSPFVCGGAPQRETAVFPQLG